MFFIEFYGFKKLARFTFRSSDFEPQFQFKNKRIWILVKCKGLKIDPLISLNKFSTNS